MLVFLYMNTINILSWNICFGCMYADGTPDRTARTLAKHCQDSRTANGGEHVCLKNIANFMNKKKYDFIGTQESTNWLQIYDIVRASIPETGYVHHKVPIGVTGYFAEIATFYNSKKFKINYAKVGNITPGTDGRPYQILFFTEISTGNNILVINLHNGHHSSIAELSARLSDNLDNCVNLTLNPNINFINIDEAVTSNNRDYITSNENKFNVVIMGDFNDHGNYNYWTGLSPFRSITWLSAGSDLRNLVLSSSTKPPKTCCTGSRTLRLGLDDPSGNGFDDRYYGDYILIDTKKWHSHHQIEYQIQQVLNMMQEYIQHQTTYQLKHQ